MGENSLGTGVARNNLDGHICLFVCVVNTNQKQTDFSVEMLLREEESLFRFSADGTQKKTGEKKKKKCPQLCILEIPMTFVSQPAKQSTCSVNRLPLLQLAGRKLTKSSCFLSRGKLLCDSRSCLALQHQPQTFYSFLGFAHQHKEGKRQRD